jgi:hypothetical protein
VYLSDVWRRRSLNSWTCLIAAIFVAGGRTVIADDQPQTDPQSGYKVTSVQVDGKTIRVKEPDPYADVKPAPPSDGKYHPAEVNYGATSAMADKTFSLPANALSKSDPEFTNGAQDTFATKPYAADSAAATVPNLNTKASLSTTSAYSRNASAFDKNYMTASDDSSQNRTAVLASVTSPDQGRAAVLGGQTTATYAAPFADKTFQGPEADAAHRHLKKLANGQILVTDLPDRPLTIDEVRDLINHGFKPNTDVAPQEQSKPLNDPDYKPEPLRETPPPDTSSAPAGDDDKNDPVPPPGTMAVPPAPENSEPLPQP